MFLRLLQEWFVSKNCVQLDVGGNRVRCRPKAEAGQVCEQSTAFGGIHNGIYR